MCITVKILLFQWKIVFCSIPSLGGKKQLIVIYTELANSLLMVKEVGFVFYSRLRCQYEDMRLTQFETKETDQSWPWIE